MIMNVICVYYRENHYSVSCQRVATIAARREALRKEGCCFVCLMRDHRSNECQNQRGSFGIVAIGIINHFVNKIPPHNLFQFRAILKCSQE